MAENNPFSTMKPPPGLGYGDYLRYSQLVQERFGLFFPEKRRMELEIGVRRAFSSSTCTDLDQYFTLLNDPVNGAPELERLVNALTVGETYFFRDAGQFSALVTRVLPDIIQRRRSVRTLRIWSAGCASGEEPYSLAMLLQDLLPDYKEWSVTILATDINTQNLERARKGVYTEWAFREERARQWRSRFFTQQGNHYVLDPVIRRMVTFSQLNLAEDSFPSYSNNTMFIDLLLCRNVTIYFPEAVTKLVIERFYNAISDSGWLVVGHSEHSLNTYQRFQAHTFPDAILYQKPAGTPLTSASNTIQPADPFTFTPVNWSEIQPKIETSTKVDFPPKLDPTPKIEAKPPQLKSSQKVDSTPLTAKTAITLPEGVNADNEFETAQVLVSFGRVEDACTLLLRWLIAHPNHPPACSLLAKLYADQSNWHEAERWCQLTIAADKLNLEAYYTLALVYQHQGVAEKALEAMKKVVYIERNDILGHYSLADLYYHQGNTSLALKSLENARRLLDTRPNDEVVPRSDGITVGRLKQAILQQQSQWANT